MKKIILLSLNYFDFEDIKEVDRKGVHSVEKSDLVFFGLVGIKDLVRKEVPQAIPMQESRNKSLHDKRR